MLHHFDYRWATYDGPDTRDLTSTKKSNPEAFALPRYWVPAGEVDARLADKWRHGWLLGWRDICRSTDVHTIIASALSRVGMGNNAPIMMVADSVVPLAGLLVASMSSFVLDFASRFKVGGSHLNLFIINQFPVLPPTTYTQPCPWGSSPTSLLPTPHSLCSWLLPGVLELTYTTWDLAPFAKDCGYNGPPFRWEEEQRCLLRCELDAAYFHLIWHCPRRCGLHYGDLPHCQTQRRGTGWRIPHQEGHFGDLRRYAAGHRHRHIVPDPSRSLAGTTGSWPPCVAPWFCVPCRLATPYS
jgi:hypothetical protein